MVYRGITSLLVICLLLSTSCEQSDSTDAFASYQQIKITHQAGDQWSEIGYLGLPTNAGKAINTNVDCLVLGVPQPVGSQIGVDILGAVQLQRDSSDQWIVLAQPANTELRAMAIKDFNHFSTVHSSAKWIIEQYLTHYHGLGSTRLIGWKDEQYVMDNLLPKS